MEQAIELEYQKGVRVVFTTECPKELLREKDVFASDEEDVIAAMVGVRIVIADPLYRPVCPKDATFMNLPAESFSGRIYRNEIPNLITGFER